MSSLIDYTASLGVKVINGCEVTGLGEKENSVKVFTNNFSAKEKISFNAKSVIVCANAFTKKIIPRLKILPGRGQVIVTKPVANLKFKGVFHFDEGFYYFRNFEKRIIFGGGRNLDFKNEETLVFEKNEKIIADLKSKLEKIILPGQKSEIEYSWSGIMGFTENKLPLIEKISDRISSVISCNGMGIAMSSFIAEEMSR